MNYEEAKKLAVAWTNGVNIGDDGWRAVMAVILAKCMGLEAEVSSLRALHYRLKEENERLSLDLGFKNEDFILPKAAIAPLIQAAKIATEINNEYARKVLDKPKPGEEFQ